MLATGTSFIPISYNTLQMQLSKQRPPMSTIRYQSQIYTESVLKQQNSSIYIKSSDTAVYIELTYLQEIYD